MSRAMKDSGIPWIGEIPEVWESKRFKYSGSLQKGKLPQSINVDSIGLPIIGASEMIGKAPRQYSSDTGLPICKIDDTLILWDGANAGLVASQLEGIVSSTAAVFSCTDSGFCSRYVFYLLKCGEKYFRDKVGGTTIPHMNPSFIDDIPMIQPSVTEQRRIVNFLDIKCGEIDDTIALQEGFISELKAYKQSVITEAVTRGLNPNVKFKDSGIDWIGKIPQGWEVCRLKNVVKKRNQKADDTTLQYIGLEHLVGFSEEMVETENVYDKEGSNMCFPDDVIFGKLRPYLGKVKVIHEQCCCSAEFLVLQGASVPAYVRYLMLSDWFIEIVNSSTYGAKMPRANADFILNMNVCFPSNIDQQRQISDHLDTKCTEIDSLIAIKQQKIEELKDYKKSVIYEYVTGKKEVNG